MSHRITSMAAAWAVLLAPAWAQATVEISNPGFEQPSAWVNVPPCAVVNKDLPSYSGKVAYGWEWDGPTCEQSGAGIGNVVYGQGVGANGTGSSMTLQSNLPDGKAAVKTWLNPSLTRGERYTVSVQLKASSASNRPVIARLELREWWFPYMPHGLKEVAVPSDGQWHTYTLVGYAPLLNRPRDGETLAPEVTYGGVFVHLASTGTLAIDNVSVVADVQTPLADIGVTRRDRLGQLIPKTYFGMHVHGHEPNWPSIGSAIGTDRLWDSAGTQWADIMANPAAPDWREFDKRVLRAAQHGAEVIVVLGGNVPGYATSDPNAQAPGCSAYYDKDRNVGKGSSAPPLEDQANGGSTAWANWVTAIASHVRDLERTAGKKLVQNWEVWNEPDKCSLLVDNPARLARLVATANTILKNPVYAAYGANRVLSPSFTLDGFMDRYLQEASNTIDFPSSSSFPYGAAFFDVLSVHAYDDLSHGPDVDDMHSKALLDDRTKLRSEDPVYGVDGRDWARMKRSPEALFHDEHVILNKREILRRFPAVANVPVWSTEGGYLGASLNGGPNDSNGARYVARHLLLGWAAGLDLNAYYAWDQRSGLNASKTLRYYPVAGGREAVEGDRVFNVTEAGLAFQQVSKWMSGAKLADMSVAYPSGLWVMTLQRNNAQAMVVWNPDSAGEDTSYTLPYGHTAITNLKGEVTTASTSTIKVGPSPVLVTAPATRVLLRASPTSIKAGQSVSFTATVSGGWRLPSGTVQFKANGINLGAPVPVTAARTATLSTNQLTKPGYVSITADYSGDTVNLPNATITPYIEIVTP